MPRWPTAAKKGDQRGRGGKAAGPWCQANTRTRERPGKRPENWQAVKVTPTSLPRNTPTDMGNPEKRPEYWHEVGLGS